jgi:hypothetical protein
LQFGWNEVGSNLPRELGKPMLVGDVLVLDASGKTLNPCSPARARILVREREASWITDTPPTIRLNRALDRSNTMPTVPQAKTITNWTEYFKDEKDIYVQNVANAQISLSFETSPGNIQGFLVPHTRDPFNLTQHIPFDAVKKSADFRRMLNRRPPALVLFDEEEYLGYYAKKAQPNGQTTEEAIDAAERRRQSIQNKTAVKDVPNPTPIHTVISDGQRLGEHKVVTSNSVGSEDEVIHPKVLHLCHQVNPVAIPDDNQKMKAHELLEELQTLEGELKLDDFEYIRAHAHWKTVKNWAKTKVAALASADGEGADDPSESINPA